MRAILLTVQSLVHQLCQLLLFSTMIPITQYSNFIYILLNQIVILSFSTQSATSWIAKIEVVVGTSADLIIGSPIDFSEKLTVLIHLALPLEHGIRW